MKDLTLSKVIDFFYYDRKKRKVKKLEKDKREKREGN